MRNVTADWQTRRVTALVMPGVMAGLKNAELAANLQRQPWNDSPVVRFAVPSRIDAAGVKRMLLSSMRPVARCKQRAAQ